MTNVIEPNPLIGARSLPLINLRKALKEGRREGGREGLSHRHPRNRE
jgi:hypothetical protein